MIGSKTAETSCVQYELEIVIDAPRERVWNALINQTSGWWLPDFHMVGRNSVVEFDTTPGGRGLIEHQQDGSFLVWYSVQYFLPEQFKIYLVGNVAPDFGGPSTSNLRLSLEPRSSGCALQVVDAHHGKVSADYIRSLQGGWNQLFQEGLRTFVES